MPADTEHDSDGCLRQPIDVRRGRRRSVELSLEAGQLVARIPRRMAQRDYQPILDGLREQLESRVRRQRVFDDEALARRAREVAAKYLHDQRLGTWSVCFSARQKKRWGSCTHEDDGGRIRISSRLKGHPNWIVDHLLLHEMAHLVHANHGPEFQSLVSRSPDHHRGQGYLEALESLDLLGYDASSAPLDSND